MKVLQSNINSSFSIKKSKFLCFGFFVDSKESVKRIISQLKTKYSDASHICYAYILDDQTYYFTDGGEPSGTAGQPIYNVLKTNNINYCLFVVIRYFGGIKFGPGPLRATFRDVTINTLKSASFKISMIADLVEVEIPYNQMTRVNRILKPFVYKQEYKKEFANLTLVGHKDIIIKQLNLIKIKPKSIKEKQVV